MHNELVTSVVPPLRSTHRATSAEPLPTCHPLDCVYSDSDASYGIPPIHSPMSQEESTVIMQLLDIAVECDSYAAVALDIFSLRRKSEGKALNANNIMGALVASGNDTSPIKCEPCDRLFRRTFDLDRHERTVHKRKKHNRCALCNNKSFSRADALIRHTRRKHKTAPELDRNTLIQARPLRA